MTNNIQIKPLCSKPDTQFMRLMDRFLDSIGEAPMTSAQRSALAQAVKDGQIHFFLAWHEEEPVGMCSVSPCFSTFGCTTSGVFDDFYIQPAYRYRGIARLLAAHAQDWCRQQGYASLTVGCSDGDIGMYQHLGFDIRLGTMLSADL